MSRRLAPSARRRPVSGARVQELGEQQADDVDEAHGEEQQRDADQHAVVLLHDVVAVEPLLDVEQPVVERARQAPGRLLAARVVVDEGLVAVAVRGGRQLRPHLDPDALRVQEILVADSMASVFQQLVLPYTCISSASPQRNGM